MFEGRKNKCSVCSRYIGQVTPTSLYENTFCKGCKSEKQVIEVKLVRAKDGEEVMTWMARGTSKIVGIDQKFIESTVKRSQ